MRKHEPILEELKDVPLAEIRYWIIGFLHEVAYELEQVHNRPASADELRKAAEKV